MLFDWRTDQESLKQSHSSTGFSFESHCLWLEQSLLSGNREIYIASLDDKNIGMVRRDLVVSDNSHPTWSLSWLVNPELRNRGHGSVMLSKFLETYPGSYSAEVKTGNIASIKMAENVGLRPSYIVFRNFE
jgi:RimJ/RimL family protein N-acetyltransferase